MTQTEIIIEFGKVARFDNGNGVLLTATTKNEAFQKLGIQLLDVLINEPRKQEAHITLMHPKNSICTDKIFKEI